MEENLNRHKAMVEANGDAKLQTIIQEQVARARLEWLKEKTSGQVDDLVHVEKSLGTQFFTSGTRTSKHYSIILYTRRVTRFTRINGCVASRERRPAK